MYLDLFIIDASDIIKLVILEIINYLLYIALPCCQLHRTCVVCYFVHLYGHLFVSDILPFPSTHTVNFNFLKTENKKLF